ncbi:MAG: hypothetical protein WC497_02790 [Patescibacteria group bacterium]
MSWFWWLLIIVYILTVVFSIVEIKKRKARATAGEPVHIGLGDYFLSKLTRIVVPLFVIIVAVCTIPGYVKYQSVIDTDNQPLWARIVYIKTHPVTENVGAALQRQAEQYQSAVAALKRVYPWFNPDTAWNIYKSMQFAIPLLTLLFAWLIARYMIKRKVTSLPGGKEGLAIIQMAVIFFACTVLIPPLTASMPLYLKILFHTVSGWLGFESASQMVLLGFILSLVAMGMNRATRLVPAMMLALALLGLSGAGLLKVGFPSLTHKPVKGFYGEALGPVIAPPLTQKLDDTRYLVAFEVSSRGPHPVALTIRPGQYLAYEQVDSTRYEWLREVTDDSTKTYTADVRGCLHQGQLAYPRIFRAPNWFYTKEAPAGALIYRIGQRGEWFPAFPPGDQIGYVQVNASGTLWLDINDTVRQGDNRYQPETDGVSCYFDNKGTARVIIHVMNEPVLAGM